MITQGPFSLTLDHLLPLDDPGATSNNPATAVQLQNSSVFIINVNIGGSIYTIQSFTAQTVPTSGGGQQMSVTPIQSTSAAGSGGGTLTVVWLLAGESSPMLDGSLTAAAIASAFSSQGIVDELYSSSTVDFAAGVPIGLVVTALHAYQTILVLVGSPAGVFTAQVVQDLGGVLPGAYPQQTQSIPTPTLVTGANVLTFLLIANIAPGSTFIVFIESSITVPDVDVYIFGLTASLIQEVSAPVGNPLATYQTGGARKATAVAASATTVSILAAPPAGFVYALKRLTVTNIANQSVLVGATSGQVYSVVGGAAPNIPVDSLHGLVCSEALNTTTNGALTSCLFYDLIPVPTIQ